VVALWLLACGAGCYRSHARASPRDTGSLGDAGPCLEIARETVESPAPLSSRVGPIWQMGTSSAITAPLANLTWSADGARLVMRAFDNTAFDGPGEVVVYEAIGDCWTTLARIHNDRAGFYLDASRDGGLIALELSRPGPGWAVYERPAGNVLEPTYTIGEDAVRDGRLHWSPRVWLDVSNIIHLRALDLTSREVRHEYTGDADLRGFESAIDRNLIAIPPIRLDLPLIRLLRYETDIGFRHLMDIDTRDISMYALGPSINLNPMGTAIASLLVRSDGRNSPVLIHLPEDFAWTASVGADWTPRFRSFLQFPSAIADGEHLVWITGVAEDQSDAAVHYYEARGDQLVETWVEQPVQDGVTLCVVSAVPGPDGRLAVVAARNCDPRVDETSPVDNELFLYVYE